MSRVFLRSGDRFGTPEEAFEMGAVYLWRWPGL